MLEFEGVSKSFAEGTVAVDGVSFAVPRGQFCVILGASGAGKSTLLRMVNGLVAPTAGRVVFEGRALDRQTLQRVRPRVAMVHQQFNLVGRLSVLDNVLTGALPRVAGWRAALRLFPGALKRRACGLLAEVGMEPGQLYRRAAALSGGQQQRVAIARAFILEPEVLLADEPVASLDPGTSVEVLSLLRRACDQHGTTALCSLHQVDLALRYADRIVAMRGGKLVFDGTPGELERRGLAGVYSRAAGHDPGRARFAAAGPDAQRMPAAAEVGLS